MLQVFYGISSRLIRNNMKSVPVEELVKVPFGLDYLLALVQCVVARLMLAEDLLVLADGHCVTPGVV